MKVVMKILKGEFCAMLCRKRSSVVSTANKEHNLSKSSSEQLGSTVEAVKKKKKKKKEATFRRCSDLFMYLLFIICPIHFPTRSLFILSCSGGNKNDCVIPLPPLLLLLRENKPNTTVRTKLETCWHDKTPVTV